MVVGAAAVVTDGRVRVADGRSPVGQLTAEAEAHHAHLAGDLLEVAQVLHGGRHVSAVLLGIRCLDQRECLFTARLVVGQVHPPFLPPEYVRGQHHESVQGILLGQGADVGVYTPDFLYQDQARAFAGGWQGQVGVESVAIAIG